jgi:hypothetical protein
MRRTITILILATAWSLLSCPVAALADPTGIPDLDLSTATVPGPGPFSVYTRPDGGGHPLSAAYLMGGQEADATITLHLVDANGDPIFMYPFEDLWLVCNAGSLALCANGSIADDYTDINGTTTFSDPLYAGGQGQGILLMVSGLPLNQPPLPISVNSPDITGDQVANLDDIVMFGMDWLGSYHYRSDFFYDGVIDISDIALFAQGLGASCP